jgi:hypothetical protein
MQKRAAQSLERDGRCDGVVDGVQTLYLCWVDEVDLNHEVKAAVSAEAQSDEESAMRLVKRLLDSIYMRLLSVGNCQSGERSVDSLRLPEKEEHDIR